MKPDRTPYDIFMETGKINDYLAYCRDRGEAVCATATKGAEPGNATENQWNYPAGPQN